jgi:zinc/manganese transport system substrate-binding protein
MHTTKTTNASSSRRRYTWGALIVLLGIVISIAMATSHSTKPATSPKIQVVAGENFWGSLAAQLGGDRVSVTSIVSDPNADPHEYESNTTTAREFQSAQYVILNGAGYDSWGNKLLSADNKPSRRVLRVATLLGKKNGDNPHFWYSPSYVNRVVAQMDRDLITIDPAGKAYYQKQLVSLMTSLAPYQNRIASIKRQFGGTKVAATEDIFQYLATAAGLDLVSPPAFTEAVAEGNDPPTASVAAFQQQLSSGQVKLLVYNEQTVTPLTNTMKQLAAENTIPIVGVTETIQPPDTSFQVWMNAELLSLENALNAQALGQ